ncbi:DUF1501 domain-containing protein [Massilia sp. W12]|uniref:DUF1501 domain-containing protein n=1 Tax=Massilia sp. W12 TaxID=3126507 RepID=UPI0030CB4303
MSVNDIKRREFLRRSGMMGGMLAGAAPWALNLAAIGEAAAQTANDYKAVVCIFLQGGNDYGNTLIPYDNANYNAYAAIRQKLAYRQSDLSATVLNPANSLPDGRQMALAPALAALKPIFDAGNLGIIANIGTLIVPTTLAQYKAQSVPLPPKLFSHNDQQSFWQAGRPEGAGSGWGGRMGDLMLSGNGGSLFTAMSISGNSLYLSGNQVSQYAVSTQGAFSMRALEGNLYGSTRASAALRSLITQSRPHQLENAYVKVTNRSLAGNAVLKSVLDPNGSLPFTTVFEAANPLAQQLKQVARLIANRGQLGAKRQVFFVSMGGFDTHDNLAAAHPVLLRQTASAMASFHAAMKELNLNDAVTSFTASDFGRTLAVNEDGSDHGWGSHHFIMGGAVNGRQIHGKLPAVAVNGPDDVGQGRLLPTTSVDQLGAAIATWFGVSASNLGTVLPNARNFDLNALRLFKTATRV